MADNDVIDRETIAMADANGNPTDKKSEAVTIEDLLTLRDGQRIMQTSAGPASPNDLP